MFLGDRSQRTCPKVQRKTNRGDNCECVCDFITPMEWSIRFSVILCDACWKNRTLFLKFPDFPRFPKPLTRSAHLQEQVAKTSYSEWLDSKLKRRDISRDAAIICFEIPDAPVKNILFWLDRHRLFTCEASKFMWSNRKVGLDEYGERTSWRGSLSDLIAKNIINSHALFWPANAGLCRPTAHRLRLIAHG